MGRSKKKGSSRIGISSRKRKISRSGRHLEFNKLFDLKIGDCPALGAVVVMS